MKMKLTSFFSLILLYSANTLAVVVPDPPSLGAKGYLLMDFNSGEVLAESNSQALLAPASLTKLMTAYVVGQEIVNDRLTWETQVEVSPNAWSVKFPDSSKMFIKPGDSVTIKDLMRGLIIQSGNDAAVALAEHVAGSEGAFVSLMNGWAQSLGMSNTNFVNAHGLDGEGIATTPKDMGILLRAIIQQVPEVYALYKERRFTWAGIEQYNRNKLLWDRTLEVDGGKTGFTESAGYSLVSSAVQGRMRLIAVVMGTASPQARVNESRQLLNYGFRFFDTLQTAKSGEVIYEARIWQGESEQVDVVVEDDIFLTLPSNQTDKLQKNLELNERLTAPITKGEVLGQLVWSLDGKTVKIASVVSAQEVKQGSMLKRLKDTFLLWFSSLIDDVKSLFGDAL